MNKNQQLAWETLEYFLKKIEMDSGHSVSHLRPALVRLKARNLAAGTVEDVTLLMRSAYGVGAGKSF